MKSKFLLVLILIFISYECSLKKSINRVDACEVYNLVIHKLNQEYDTSVYESVFYFDKISKDHDIRNDQIYRTIKNTSDSLNFMTYVKNISKSKYSIFSYNQNLECIKINNEKIIKYGSIIYEDWIDLLNSSFWENLNKVHPNDYNNLFILSNIFRYKNICYLFLKSHSNYKEGEGFIITFYYNKIIQKWELKEFQRIYVV